MKIKIEIDTSRKEVDRIEVTYDGSKEDRVTEFAKGKEICDTLFDDYLKYFKDEEDL